MAWRLLPFVRGLRVGRHTLPPVLRRWASTTATAGASPTISLGERRLRLTWSDRAGPPQELVYAWLRDHCQCPECLHPHTKQRLFNSALIPENLTPVQASVTGEQLQIQWQQDPHRTVFPLSWLRERGPRVPDAGRGAVKWWGAEIAQRPPHIDVQTVLQDEQGVLRWVSMIEKYGFAIVTGVEPTTAATQQLCERIGVLRNTIFGEFWDFTANMEHADTAYTTQALELHTDGTYFEDPNGLQTLHCIEYEAEGGYNTLTDGFRAAAELQRTAPDAYEFFSTVRLPFRYRDLEKGHDLRYEGLVLQHRDCELTDVRFNNDDRDTLDLPADQVEAFYRHLKPWLRALRNPAAQYRFLLQPGMMLTFHNRRVLHGRESYVGKRRLCGSYHSEDDFRSRLRSLRLKYGPVDV